MFFKLSKFELVLLGQLLRLNGEFIIHIILNDRYLVLVILNHTFNVSFVGF